MVIVIFTVISSVVIFRQSKFSSDILITNLAYQLALEVRQAQTYGIGVRAVASVSSKFKYGYGIHLGPDSVDRQALFPSNPSSSFILFVDSYDLGINPDGNDRIYGEGNPPTDDFDEHLETFKLPGGNTITDYCYGTGDARTTLFCKSDAVAGPKTIDVTFVRPRPDAHITTDGQSTPEYAGPVSIILKSALGDKCKKVSILATGQISVDPSNVPCVFPYIASST